MSETERSSRHAEEARERWGDTEAYRESRRRTNGYTDAEKEAIQEELEEVESRFADLLEQGVPADDPRAVETAERARRHIDRWYYPCSHGMHAGLAEMYLADPRFRAHYEERRPGLAEFVVAAIRANVARAEGTEGS